MPTDRCSRPVSLLAPLLVTVGLVALSGCSLASGDGDSDPAAATAPAATPTAPFAAPPSVVSGLQATLDGRATAVLAGDARGFLGGLAAGDRVLRSSQRTYFDNLRQLPLGSVSYELEPTGLLRDGNDYLAVVDLTLQLTGFDALPVRTRDRFRFSPDGRDGAFVVSSAGDAAWRTENQVVAQPWDLGAVVVRSVPGVLGIFDASSVATADPLLADVQQAITDVSALVPLDWSRSVVLYALSDPTFLASIPDLPGGDPRTLDGVAFPVASEPDGEELASTRFVLAPRLVTGGGAARSRLIRHELTHVAIGERDDHAPVWLSEGLAEYVSVRQLPPESRGVSQSALDAARAGFTDLPADAAFNDADSRVHYGESWWVCEYVAASFGEQTLWSLLEQLDDPELDATEQNAVLRSWIGLGTRQLARRAGSLMVLTFEPPVVAPPPAPTVSPDPAGSTAPATPAA